MKKELLYLFLILLSLSGEVATAQEKNGFYVDFGAGFSNEQKFHYALPFRRQTVRPKPLFIHPM